MSIESICQAIQDSSVGMSLRESTYMWPAIEAAHVLSLALSVGTIILVDLRLIGATMRNEPVTDVIEQTSPWSTAGFIVAFISGIFSSGLKPGGSIPAFLFASSWCLSLCSG